MSARDKILARIHALRAKTVSHGCTEAEAMAAAEMVNTLMERYAIEASDLEAKPQPSSMKWEEFRLDPCIKDQAATFLASAVAEFTETMCWLTGGDRSRPCFFGEPQDVEIAHYLMAVCERAMEHEYFRFRANTGQRSQKARMSFKIGCAMRLSERLTTMKQSRDQAVASAGKALVPIAKKAAVEERAEELGIKLGKGRKSRSRTVDGDAYLAGHEAGGRIALSPGIKGQSRPAALLG